MMKTAALLVLMFALITAQAQTSIWQKTYSSDRYDYGKAVTNTSDGGHAILGSTSSWGSGTTDVYLIKIDADGNLLWSKTYGGTNIERGYDILEMPDSTLFITGITNSMGDGGYDAYFIRTDKFGEVIWETTVGGSDWDFAYAAHLAPDTTIMIVGETYSKGAGDADGWIIHLEEDCTLISDNTFGGTAHDDFQDIDTLDGGGYVVVGGTNSFGAGGEDLYLLRLDGNGTLVWETTLGGTGEEYGEVVFQAEDGNFIVNGGNSSDTGEPQQWYFSYDQNNTAMVWERIIGGVGNDEGRAALQFFWSPGLIFAGQTESLGFGAPGDILKSYRTDGGIFISSTTIGDVNLDEVEMAIATPDTGFLFVGSTTSFGVNYSAVFAVKFDRNCNTTPAPDNVIDVNAIGDAPDVAVNHTVYPNPVERNGTLQIGDLYQPGGDHQMVWYDLTGRELHAIDVNSAAVALDGQLPEGLVLYRLLRDGVVVARGVLRVRN